MPLSANSIICLRGENTVLHDLSFMLGDGETMVVTGANGSGKSTLLRALAGLNDPVSGTVDRLPAHWIGPDLPLKKNLTVRDNLAFWLAMQGGSNRDTILRALHHFEIAHLANRPVSTLSSGQKQRVALARLFLTEEKLWLLDEPETRLDAAGREMMQAAVDQHSGMTVIATHNTDAWNATHTLNLSTPPRHPGESRYPYDGKNDSDLGQLINTMDPGFRRDDVNVGTTFTATLRRDMSLLIKSKADILQPVMLFTLLIILFPLTIGPDTATLAPLSGGLLMMAAFFASLLPLENIFVDDATDGTIETLMTTSAPMPVYTAARMLAHWCANGLPVTLLSPFALTLLGAHLKTASVFLTIGAATLLFTLIGAAISALVLSTHKGAVLLALLTAPLYIPVLIFGSGALGETTSPTPLALLWAMVALFLPLAPLMAAGCLRLMRD